jgi:hypothetical protein
MLRFVSRCTPAVLFTIPLLLAASPAGSASSRFGAYQYLSPVPGSAMVSPPNNLVLREGRELDPGAWQAVSLWEFRDGGRRAGLRILLAPRDAWIGLPRT